MSAHDKGIRMNPLIREKTLAEGNDQPKAEDPPPPQGCIDPHDLVGVLEEEEEMGPRLAEEDHYLMVLVHQLSSPALKRKHKDN